MPTEPKKEPEPDLAALAESIDSLKKAVKKSNPLLRTVAESRLYPILALVYGVIIVIACLMARNSSAEGRDPSLGGISLAAPWILLALLAIAGGAVKVALTKRLAMKHGPGGFGKVLMTIFGGKTVTIYISTAVAMTAGIIFTINNGHPWYILSLACFMASIIALSLDILIDLLEYKVMGWVALGVGVASLFMVETDPLLWVAIVTGGIFCGFGVSGILRSFLAGK